MPEFSSQSIAPRQQVEGAEQRQVQLQNTQAPIIAAPESNLTRLGAALGIATQGATAYVQEQNKELDVADSAQATKHFTEGLPMSEAASPAYKRTYMSLVGQNYAYEVNQKITQDFEANKNDPQYDPVASARKIQAKGIAGITNPHAIEGFWKTTGHMEQAAQTAWLQQQKENLRQDTLSNGRKLIADTFNTTGTVEERLAALDGAKEQLVNLGISKLDADKEVFNHAYAALSAGDLGMKELLLSKGKSGLSLADRQDHGEAYVEHAYQQAVTLNEKNAIKARQDGALTEAISWEETLQQVTETTDPITTVLSKYGGAGSFISTPGDFEQRVQQIRTVQAGLMKGRVFEQTVQANPLMAHTLAASDPESATKWRNSESSAIFSQVKPNDPSTVQKAVGQAHAWMDLYQGEILPGYKNLMQSGMSTLQPMTKDANGVGQVPAGFKMVYQEYLRDKSGNQKRLGQAISEQDIDLLRVFDDAQAFGSNNETQAYQAVLNFKDRDPNDKKPITQALLEKVRSGVSDAATSYFKFGEGQNIDQLQDVAIAKAKSLMQTYNVSEEQAARLSVDYVKDNTVDVAGGKTFYPANIYTGLDKDKFANTLEGVISSVKAEPVNNDVSAVQAYTMRDGTVRIQGLKPGVYSPMVLRELSPDQVKQEFSDQLDVIGMRAGDTTHMQQLKRVLADPNSSEAQSLSSTQVKALEPLYDLVKRRGVKADPNALEHMMNGTYNDDPTYQAFKTIRERADLNDRQRMTDMQNLVLTVSKLSSQQSLVPQTGYPTDVFNPGGNNMRTIDYSINAAKSGNFGASLTMLAEGLRLNAYSDEGGHRTIGLGYNIDAHGDDKAAKDLKAAGVSPANVPLVLKGKMEITPDQAVALYQNVMKSEYLPRAKEAFGPQFDQLPPHVKAVLGDLAYTAGSIDKFQTALSCIEQGDFKKAGECINLTYRDSNGNKVRNERRIDMYRQMLAGGSVWNNYLATTLKQTSKR